MLLHEHLCLNIFVPTDVAHANRDMWQLSRKSSQKLLVALSACFVFLNPLTVLRILWGVIIIAALAIFFVAAFFGSTDTSGNVNAS